MLLRLLKSWRGSQPSAAAPAARDAESMAHAARLERAHGGAPREMHLQILFDNLRIGGEPVRELVDRCMKESFAQSTASKALHKPLASYFLAQYFLHAMGIEGDFAECGVFQGTSALLLCRAARTREPSYAGAKLHLIDSFAGLSAPTEEDTFPIATADGKLKRGMQPSGAYAAPIEAARTALQDFPLVTFHSGWIPAALAGLPETRWAFVHVDVDLFEPTYECLKYFYPRLAPQGVLICDDYGAPFFPGARRAWDRYCDEHDIPYVVLDTGQAVILKP